MRRHLNTEEISAARQNLATYPEVYNARQPRESHVGRTPDLVRLDILPAQ